MLKDHRGAQVSGANREALARYEAALAQLNCYQGDPVATLDEALALSPDFPMARIMKAWCLLSASEKDLVAPATSVLEEAAASPMTDRERAHHAAATALAQGEFDDASRRLDALLVDHPRDILALQMGHVLDFFRGDARNLRDRVARVLPEWSRHSVGYHAVLGMQAFGLEECGDYGRAEAFGREAVSLNPLDGWAHHAVAHVMEMQGRVGEGLAWLEEGSPRWAPGSFMAVHNWWHLALFRLEQDDASGALRLYDGAVRGGQSSSVLDMVDASALLWRMSLRGVDLGSRWEALAERWAPRFEDGFYAFNDVHALMACLGAGRLGDAARIVAAMDRAAEAGESSNRAMTREVGLPLAKALLAFHGGRWDGATRILLPLRGHAHRFGGSHAQRDLFDLTLIEAAKRAGEGALVRALANERLQHRPESPLARRYRERGAPALAA